MRQLRPDEPLKNFIGKKILLKTNGVDYLIYRVFARGPTIVAQSFYLDGRICGPGNERTSDVSLSGLFSFNNSFQWYLFADDKFDEYKKHLMENV